uniref:Sulfotransferase n=3 Tax=Nicotiana TaxID=4085 RepID=A0A1S4AND5_TOBAC|nr:PREDICTED: cytosolic sulfotransferase 13-like [Nicotiana sylvestris]XP_016478144.1 PREDICTED: cytosolic sulfotransferase 13-like [Nicotiana tabacum]
MEINSTKKLTFQDTELPLLPTHLPYICLPPSILESKCKIIYICRKPKDTFVSTWHYKQRLKENISEIRNNSTTLEQEFKWFLEDKLAYGPYWDHVYEFWKASRDTPEKVMFIQYEDLKRDTLWYLKKLAEFIGKPFSEEEEKQCVAS